MNWILIWMLSAWACLAGVSPVLMSEYTTNSIPSSNRWSIVVYGITNANYVGTQTYNFARNLARYNGVYYFSNSTMNIPNLTRGGYVNNTTNFFHTASPITGVTGSWVFASPNPAGSPDGNGIPANVDIFDGTPVLPTSSDGTLVALSSGGVMNDNSNTSPIENVKINYYQKSLSSAPIITSASYPTNQFSVGFTYFTGPYRSMLIGSAVMQPQSGASENSGINIVYINNGVSYTLQIQTPHQGSAGQSFTPFSIPLSPNSSFQIIANNGGSATSWVTNTVLWNY